MATFGGVFFEQQKRNEFEACGFDRLSFVRRSGEAFRILAPKLTLREMAHLERQLPFESGANPHYGPMPEKDATNIFNSTAICQCFFQSTSCEVLSLDHVSGKMRAVRLCKCIVSCALECRVLIRLLSACVTLIHVR